jgi:hypothetical protein
VALGPAEGEQAEEAAPRQQRHQGQGAPPSGSPARAGRGSGRPPRPGRPCPPPARRAGCPGAGPGGCRLA